MSGAENMSASKNVRASASPVAEVRATGAAGPVPTTEPGRSTLRHPIGRCGHQVDWSDWWAGYRICAGCEGDEIADLRPEKYYDLAPEDVGHAGLSLVLPGLFAGALLLIAAVSGKLGYLVEHLPLTERPNGFTLLVLICLVAVCCWRVRLRRLVDRGLEIDRDPDDMFSPVVTELTGPWFSTVAVEHPTDVTR